MSRIRRSQRLRGPAAWALLVVLGVPFGAEAQLFPNLPIHKRQRPDCAHEAPVYGIYRHQYYGYHPTCWRTFPPGWGCPSKEAPNWQAELQQTPLQTPDEPAEPFDPFDIAPPGAGPGPFEPSDPGRMPDIPAPDRSPFDLDMDRPGGADPFDRQPVPRGGADPFRREAPQPPAGGGSPFDLTPPGGAATGGAVPPLGAVPAIEPPGDPSAMAGTFEYIPEERLDPPDFPMVPGPIEMQMAEDSRLTPLPEPGRGEPLTFADLESMQPYSQLQPQPDFGFGEEVPMGRAPETYSMEDPTEMDFGDGREQGRRPGFLSRLMFGRGLRR